MHVIPAPAPNSDVGIHMLSNGRVSVSHASGGAHDAAPAPIDRAGGAALTDNRSPGPALPLATNDQETTGGAPDAISTLLAFLKDKLEDTDLVQAQQLVEQALSDTSDNSGAGNMSAGTPAMDAAARRRLAQRQAAARGFNERWGANAGRIRVV